MRSVLAAALLFGTLSLPVLANESAKTEQSAIHEGTIGSAKWKIDANGVLTIGAGEYNSLADSTDWPWTQYLSDVKAVDGTANFKASGSLAYAFINSDFSKPCQLTSIDLSGWDTSNVTSMKCMFASQYALTSVNLSKLDTSSVTNMEAMFATCSSLQTIDLSSFDTSKVERMGSMFSQCESLRTLDVSHFDTSSLHEGENRESSSKDVIHEAALGTSALAAMFGGCSSLTSLDLSGWDLSGVKMMALMFCDCHSLQDLNVSGWDTSSAENLQSMFSGCTSLKNLDLSSWDVSRVTSMYALFDSCVELESLNLSGWNVHATNFEHAFDGCRKISSVQYSKSTLPLLHRLPAHADWAFNGSGSYEISSLPDLDESADATITRTFKESLKPLRSVNVSGIETQYDWTGHAISPNFKLKDGDADLKWFTSYVSYTTDCVNPGEATIHIIGTGDYEGEIVKTYKIVKDSAEKPGTSNPDDSSQKPSDQKPSDSSSQTAKKVQMHRLYNPNSGEHFYTADKNEKDHLVAVGWKYEGEGWKAPDQSKTPVYRLYNANAGDHHYTLDANEKDYLVKVGWKYEGIGWYSDDAKSVPLYRQYNPNAKAGSHNYTTNKAENDSLVKLGWKAEGIGWYGMK